MMRRFYDAKWLRGFLFAGFTLWLAFAMAACGTESTNTGSDASEQGDADSGDDPPGPGDITNVCCEVDGASTYTTNVDCASASGQEVSLLECPVMCCHLPDNTYAEIAPVDCAPDGLPTHPGHCVDVCCQIGDEPPILIFQGNCDVQAGEEVDLAQCAPEEETFCCRYLDGTFGLATESECAEGPGQQTEEMFCEEVCCQAANGTVETMLSGSCEMQGGQSVDTSLCDSPPEEVCCLQADGAYSFVAAGQCESGNIVPDTMCEEVVETVCCEQPEGVYETVIAEMCPEGAAVDPAMCQPEQDEKVCCEQSNGTYIIVAAEDCPEVLVVDEELCKTEPPQEVCCKNPQGPEWVSEEACPEQQLLPDALCDELFCCKIMEGPNVGDALTITATECDGLGGSVVYDAYCEQTICCDTPEGPQLTSFDSCTFANLLETGQCEPEETYCCKIMEGPNVGSATLATMTDCANAGGAFVADDYCTQEICCQTESGPTLMPYVDCTFMTLLETSACDPPAELGCCKDMENPGLGDAWMATAEDCYAQGGAPIYDDYCDQEVCCDMGQGPSYMPYMDCTFFALVATYSDSDAPCDPPEEPQCCQIVLGPQTGNVLLATPAECTLADGVIQSADYCDQEVCCDDGSGPQLVTLLECAFLDVVSTDQCQVEEPGCCKISFGPDTGNVLIATPSECEEQGGIMTDLDYCEQMMCCSTEDGPQMLPFLECPFANVLSPDACTPPEDEMICCQVGEDTTYITQPECDAQGGVVVADDACSLCCKNPYGNGPEYAPPADCDQEQPEDICDPEPVDELVCCLLTDGSDYILQSACDAAGATTGTLMDCRECCLYPDGQTSLDFIQMCLDGEGVVSEPEVCQPAPPDEDICCQQGEDFNYIPQSQCTESGGATAAPAQCVVCCEYSAGTYGNDPAEFCLAGLGTIVDDSLCEPPADEHICCQQGEDFNYIPQSQCTESGGATAAPAQCIVCCEYSAGAYGNDPAEFCLAGLGTIVDDALCEPPSDDDVCCQLGEDASYIPSSECTAQAGSPTDLTACQVCCKNPNNNGPEWVFPEACDPGQVQPDSVCD